MGDSEAESSPLAFFLDQFGTQRAFVLALEVLQRALADLQRHADLANVLVHRVWHERDLELWS